MTWFKVDDDLAFHHKVVAAGNAAMGLWVRAGSWSAQHLTDGFIPEHMIGTMGSPAQRTKLIKAGLWVEVDGGCQFHQWNENGRQPTAESVREKRSRAAERQAKHRTQLFKNLQADEASNDVTDASVTGDVTPLLTPPPTRPDPVSPSGDTSTTPPTARAAAKTEPDLFDEFWAAYPRKDDKQDARKAWASAMRRKADPQTVIAAAKRYAQEREGQERKFTKLGASWLNKGSYENQPEQGHLSLVPPTARSLDELRERADARSASRLLGIAYIPDPQPPRDQTPPEVWDREQALAFIDHHATALADAMRRAG